MVSLASWVAEGRFAVPALQIELPNPAWAFLNDGLLKQLGQAVSSVEILFHKRPKQKTRLML